MYDGCVGGWSVDGRVYACENVGKVPAHDDGQYVHEEWQDAKQDRAGAPRGAARVSGGKRRSLWV